MFKYRLILICSIGALLCPIYAVIFFGWAAQATTDDAMTHRARILGDLWSFVFCVSLVGLLVSVVRLVQLYKTRKNAIAKSLSDESSIVDYE
jgi:hypothetical protein